MGGPASRFLDEVRAQLDGMRSTRYQHTTDVDAGSGTYFYDCSGLIEYALARSVPDALRVLPTSSKARPLAVDIAWHLLRAPTHPGDPWLGLPTAAELRPGDLIAWVTPRGSRSRNTGHVMVVTAAPAPCPGRRDEWLVEIVDSTSTPHAVDSRRDGRTGLGSGTVGLVVDSEGRPTAYRWRGAESPNAPRTLVALGRLRDVGGRDMGGRDMGGRDVGGRDVGGPDVGGRDDGATGTEGIGVRGGRADRRCWARRIRALHSRPGPVTGSTAPPW